MSSLVLFDLEYTTWDGAMQRDWQGPGEAREIIQIGALKVDWPSGKVLDTLDLIVRPVLNPVLSAYCRELTNISQHRIDDEGISFDAALEKFLGFCGAVRTYSYGLDYIILGENIGLHRSRLYNLLKRDAPDFANIGTVITKADPSIDGQGINSGRLWQYYGLEKPAGSGEHDGLFDCHSILAALRHLVAVGKLDPARLA